MLKERDHCHAWVPSPVEGGSQSLPDIGVIPQACLANAGPGGRGPLPSDLFVWGCASSTLGFFTHLATESQDEPPPLLSPNSFPVRPAPSPPAPNHCSFLPQVYRPRKQPLSSNIPCTCDACYSPDITAKYHGSSYDAYMIQRSQVSQLLRRHLPPPGGVGVHKSYILF